MKKLLLSIIILLYIIFLIINYKSDIKIIYLYKQIIFFYKKYFLLKQTDPERKIGSLDYFNFYVVSDDNFLVASMLQC